MMPTTFVLSSEDAAAHSGTWPEFTDRFARLGARRFLKETLPPKQCLNNLWVVKGVASRVGRANVRVVSDVAKIQTLLHDSETVVQKYYHINIGEDNFEYVGSPDHKRWLSIKGKSSDDKAEGSKQDAA